MTSQVGPNRARLLPRHCSFSACANLGRKHRGKVRTTVIRWWYSTYATALLAAFENGERMVARRVQALRSYPFSEELMEGFLRLCNALCAARRNMPFHPGHLGSPHGNPLPHMRICHACFILGTSITAFAGAFIVR